MSWIEKSKTIEKVDDSSYKGDNINIISANSTNL